MHPQDTNRCPPRREGTIDPLDEGAGPPQLYDNALHCLFYIVRITFLGLCSNVVLGARGSRDGPMWGEGHDINSTVACNNKKL